MHKIIFITVRADTVETAVNAAQAAFDQHLSTAARGGYHDSPYDYGTPMVAGQNIAGSDRWTEFDDDPPAAPADSEQGQDWLRRGYESGQQSFAKHLFAVLGELDRRADMDALVATLRDQVDLIDPDPDATLHSSATAGAALADELERQGVFDHLLADRMWRYHAGFLQESAMTASLFDDAVYDDRSFLTVDNPSDYHKLMDAIDERDDVWVVPLDVHH